jgi:hypothetical protein
MPSTTSCRTHAATRFAAVIATSVLVIGLLPSAPAAATSLDTVAKIEAALCPTGANSTGGTAVLTGDVQQAGTPGNFSSGGVLEIAEDCVAVLDLNGRKLELANIWLRAGSSLTIVDLAGGGQLVVDAAAGPRVSGIDLTDDQADVPRDASLAIQGGTVVATGRNGGPGIKGGTVAISGGTVIATGVGGGAGIRLGVLTVSGGTVTATGGAGGGAGIGGSEGRDGGVVTISGGTVTATGGDGGDGGGAGIGGGGDGGEGGVVTISGGTVTAIGGECAAGIGGGCGADSGGTVSITGGSVTATAGSVDQPPAVAAISGTLDLGAGAVRVDSVEADLPVTRITFPSTAMPTTPAGPSFFAPGGVQPSQPVASAAFVRADGTPEQLAASVPGRNQVRYEADGVRITLQGGSGTSVPRGLVANPAGEVICEVCIASLTAGQVVEVWLFSTPRLVAAHLVDDAECQLFAVPMVAPLDGAGPVPAGAHTLQFTLVTSDGVQAVNVGLTVGDLMPARIPAGEGPSMPRASVLLSIAFLSVAAVLGRRRSVIAT